MSTLNVAGYLKGQKSNLDDCHHHLSYFSRWSTLCNQMCSSSVSVCVRYACQTRCVVAVSLTKYWTSFWLFFMFHSLSFWIPTIFLLEGPVPTKAKLGRLSLMSSSRTAKKYPSSNVKLCDDIFPTSCRIAGYTHNSFPNPKWFSGPPWLIATLFSAHLFRFIDEPCLYSIIKSLTCIKSWEDLKEKNRMKMTIVNAREYVMSWRHLSVIYRVGSMVRGDRCSNRRGLGVFGDVWSL